MRDYREETEKRVAFIRERLAESGAKGVVYGNSGGKDSALAGILCKKACENTVGIVMPCQSKRNFGEDMADGLAVAEKFGIEVRTVDLTPVKEAFTAALGGAAELNSAADTNINPRLRMTPSTPWPPRKTAWWRARATAASGIWAISPSGATGPAISTPSTT